RSRSLGVGSATTRQYRGLSSSVMRLIVPPLPAVSRPSKTTTSRSPRWWIHSCMNSSSIWSRSSSASYSLTDSTAARSWTLSTSMSGSSPRGGPASRGEGHQTGAEPGRDVPPAWDLGPTRSGPLVSAPSAARPPIINTTPRAVLNGRGPDHGTKEPRNEAQDPRHHVQRGRPRPRRPAPGDGHRADQQRQLRQELPPRPADRPGQQVQARPGPHRRGEGPALPRQVR